MESTIAKEITEYSVTTAALAELKIKLKDIKYDVTTAVGMNTAKQDRRELVALRTSLESKRKEIKAPALAHCKLIDDEAKRITAELMALETPIDEQIKAEEQRKAEEKAQRDRLAAEAQKVLDDKILEISKLPMKCFNETSGDITIFLAALEARPFGKEFAGTTLARAEEAKAEAVEEIRAILARTIESEEAAARVEAERIEREKQEAIQREELARQQAELAEQKRLQDIENAKQLAELKELQRQQAEAQKKIDEANAAEQKRLDAIRAADEKKAAEERAKIESERKAHEAALMAEEKEKARIAALKAAEEEAARLAAEKAQRLAEAKCKDAATAFRKILDICNGNQSAIEMVAEIAIIAEGNL